MSVSYAEQLKLTYFKEFQVENKTEPVHSQLFENIIYVDGHETAEQTML